MAKNTVNLKPPVKMTLEERIKKAISNIDAAMPQVKAENKTQTFVGTQFLENQRTLLTNLLERDTW